MHRRLSDFRSAAGDTARHRIEESGAVAGVDAEVLAPVIGIVVKRWPRLSETFVLNEILGLERAGLKLRIYALMHPHEPAVQAAIGDVQAPVSYLRTGSGADLGVLVRAQVALLFTRPRSYLRTLAYVLARRRHRSTFVHLFEAARLIWLLREHGVSHVHAQFAHGPTSVAHFAYLLGDIPFSFTGHAKDLYLSAPDLLAVKISAARFVATCTAHNVAYLQNLVPAEDRAKIHLVYHGVETQRFRPSPAAEGPRAMGSTSPVRMISVGRLVEKKGFAYLVRACALLRQRGHGFTLGIYGTGPQRDELACLVDALRLGDVVQLQGSCTQDGLIDRYREADLFVLSPHVLENGDRDGIPNVLMEAMAIGLPVVATTVSGIPELVEHDRSGLLVSPRDEFALSDALERLLDPLHGPPLRARLGSGARQRVIERFDAALHLKRMVELLDRETRVGLLPRRNTVSERASRTRMILVRHGTTEWTEAGRYQGNTSDIPLSASGRLQARHLAAALEPLRVAAVVCSPFLRAVETAACIAAPHGLFAAPEAAFREVSLGDWEGLTSSEAAARDPELDERWRNGEAMARPPGGETLYEAAERAIPALEALVARYAGEKVVLVTHNWIVRLVVCHALGVGLSTVARMQCRPGSITIVDVRSGEYVVRLLNATSHLQKSGTGNH